MVFVTRPGNAPPGHHSDDSLEWMHDATQHSGAPCGGPRCCCRSWACSPQPAAATGRRRIPRPPATVRRRRVLLRGRDGDLRGPLSPGGGYDVIARGMRPSSRRSSAPTGRRRERARRRWLTAANKLFNAEPDGLTFGIFAAQGIVGSALAGAEGASLRPRAVHLRGPAGRGRPRPAGQPGQRPESIDDLLGRRRTSTPRPASAPPTTSTPTCCPPSSASRTTSRSSPASRARPRPSSPSPPVRSSSAAARSAPASTASRTATRVPLLLMGRERPRPADVPALLELDLENPELAEAYIGLQEVGRSVFAPPTWRRTA